MKANVAKNSLTIAQEGITLYVNGDKGRAICFNPEDVGFAERFFALGKSLEEKQAQLEKNGNGEQSAEESLGAMKAFFAFMRGEIDRVFGEGTSQAAFGEMNTMDMLRQFFDGLVPHIQQAREKRMEQYLGGGEGLGEE